MMQLIEQIIPEHTEVAEVLTNMINQFRFDEIFQLTEIVINHCS